MKLAVRELINTFRNARDADVLFHDVVVRSHILVAKGLILAIAVVACRFEIQIA